MPNYACRLAFTAEQEKLLSDYLVQCSAMCYGKSTRDVREIAYEMAVINNINVPCNWHRDKKAGLEWMRSYLKRNELSLRTPEGCSLSRMTSFNKYNVDLFFKNLESIYEKEETFANGTRVWNLDETGTSTVHKSSKIIAKKGIKQVNVATSQERGVLVTTCVAVSAMGSFIPPIMVFPRKHFKPHMINGAPPGTLGLATPSGWMTSDLFPQVMQHFIKFTSASKENPCLLIMDNHESHLSIVAIELAKSNGVTILTLPPHSSHRMQPLDVSVYGPFKAYYGQAVTSWLMAHPGIPLSIYDIASCVGTAIGKSLVPCNITKGFKHSGIFPFDKTVFSEADFYCSSVTDRENPMNESCEAGPSSRPTSVPGISASTHSADESTDAGSIREIPATPSASSNSVNQSKIFRSPAEFKGFPKAKPRKLNRKPREKATSIIATSTPEKLKLQQKAEKRKAKVATKRVLFTKKPRKETESEEELGSYLSCSSDESFESFSELEKDTTLQFFDGKLDRPLMKDEFVLIEFSDKFKFYYVGQYTGVTASDGAYEINFLRRNRKLENTFFFPNIPDIADVPEKDIKLILPPPTNVTGTKRMQGKIKFDIIFSNIDLR